MIGTGETQPLLRSLTNEGQQYALDIDNDKTETIIVEFDPAGDGENPLDWPTPFKWTIVSLLVMTAFTVTMACMSVVPLANEIVHDLSPPDSSSSKSASVLLVTIWELGEAAGPLLIAPLSEMYGRYPVMNACNILFIAATIFAATSNSVSQFVLARMLTGLVVAVNVLNPAIVGDLFISEQRGSAVSLIFLAPLLGGALGPLIGSAVAQTYGWRTSVWMCAMLAMTCEVLFLVCFRETYQVSILRKRAKKMAEHAANSGKTFKTAFDVAEEGGLENAAPSGSWSRLRDAVQRPVQVLFGSGVLMAMSLFGSIVFAFFYVESTSLAGILQDVYGLSPMAVGVCYASFTIGSICSVFICNHLLDRIYIRLRDTNKGVGQPEHRLPLSIIGALTLPLAVAAFGWIPEFAPPLFIMLLAVSFLGCTLMLALIPVMAFIVDAFGVYSASALTGVMVTRCLMGTFMPLTAPPLVDNFGYGWGFSVLALLALLIAPIPILMMRYGQRWRQFSKFSREQQS
ncbi:major facilitator superfamily domain-containing protein [Podospora fimiseda]|uniref:Major facilitator superfamily domain-containing protein n=1 Tax=Podospora fimiseda TaxID=252190 RepID=A0AAN7BJP0_9PEZI|nr:major facilitator superfamily domain-containing protein [Podospora fimiseda]